jgi:hypothetical protein
VGVKVRFALYHAEDSAIGADDKRHSGNRQNAEPFDPKLFRNSLFGVGKKEEAEGIHFVELVEPIGPIGADSSNRDSQRIKLAMKVSEVAAFLGSTRGHGLDVEVQDRRAFGRHGCEGHVLAVLIRQGEVVY